MLFRSARKERSSLVCLFVTLTSKKKKNKMSDAAARVQIVCGSLTAIMEEYNIFAKAQQLLAQVLPSRTLSTAQRLSAAVQNARAPEQNTSSGRNRTSTTYTHKRLNNPGAEVESEDKNHKAWEVQEEDAASTCMAALQLPADLLQRWLAQREAEKVDISDPQDLVVHTATTTLIKNAATKQVLPAAENQRTLSVRTCVSGVDDIDSSVTRVASGEIDNNNNTLTTTSSSQERWLTVQPALEYASATYGPLHAIHWPQWEEVRALHHAEHAPTLIPFTDKPTLSDLPCALVEVVLLWFHEGSMFRVAPAELAEAEGQNQDQNSHLSQAAVVAITARKGTPPVHHAVPAPAISTRAMPASAASLSASQSPLPLRVQSPPTPAASSSSFLTCLVELEFPPGTLQPRRLPVPLTEPLLTRQELIELVRRTANVRKYYGLRVAYRVWPHAPRAPGTVGPGGAFENRSTTNACSAASSSFASGRLSYLNRATTGGGGGSYTPTTGAPPLRAIESDEATAAFLRDALTYGSAALRVVAVHSVRAGNAAASRNTSPLPSTPFTLRDTASASTISHARASMEAERAHVLQNDADKSFNHDNKCGNDENGGGVVGRLKSMTAASRQAEPRVTNPVKAVEVPTFSADDDDDDDAIAHDGGVNRNAEEETAVEVKPLSPLTPAKACTVKPPPIETGDADQGQLDGEEEGETGCDDDDDARPEQQAQQEGEEEETAATNAPSLSAFPPLPAHNKERVSFPEGRAGNTALNTPPSYAPTESTAEKQKLSPPAPLSLQPHGSHTERDVDGCNSNTDTAAGEHPRFHQDKKNNENEDSDDAPPFARSLGAARVLEMSNVARRPTTSEGRETAAAATGMLSRSVAVLGDGTATSNTPLSTSQPSSGHSHTRGPPQSSQSDDEGRGVLNAMNEQGGLFRGDDNAVLIADVVQQARNEVERDKERCGQTEQRVQHAVPTTPSLPAAPLTPQQQQQQQREQVAQQQQQQPAAAATAADAASTAAAVAAARIDDDFGETWRNPEFYGRHARGRVAAAAATQQQQQQQRQQQQAELSAAISSVAANAAANAAAAAAAAAAQNNNSNSALPPSVTAASTTAGRRGLEVQKGKAVKSAMSLSAFTACDNDAPTSMAGLSQMHRNLVQPFAGLAPSDAPSARIMKQAIDDNAKSRANEVRDNVALNSGTAPAVSTTTTSATTTAGATQSTNNSLLTNQPARADVTAETTTSSISSCCALGPESIVFVRYEVDPTAVYVTGPVSQAVLQHLQDVIFRRCCAHLGIDVDAPRPYFHVNTDSSHGNSLNSACSAPANRIPGDCGAATSPRALLPRVEYVLPLYGYKFTRAEENALECCVAEVMAVYQGLEQLPAKEAEKWVQSTRIDIAAPAR